MSVEDSSRLFVGGLPEDRVVEKWELEAVFAPYGEVKDVWIAREPPGYAFVEFEKVESALESLDALNETEALGTTIRIERTKAKGEGGRGRGGSFGRGGRGRGGNERGGRGRGSRGSGNDKEADMENSSRLFVGGLPEDSVVEKWEVEAVFAPYGEVKDVWIAREPPGYAFVEFEKVESAIEALDALNQTEALGTTIRIERTKSRGSGGRGGGGRGGGGTDRGGRGRGGRGDGGRNNGDGMSAKDSPRLFVGGLPEDRAVEKWELEAVFAPYGEVKDVWVARDPPGYAFVEFEKVECAEEASQALDQSKAFGTTIRIERTKPKVDGGRGRGGRGRDFGGRGDRGRGGRGRGRGHFDGWKEESLYDTAYPSFEEEGKDAKPRLYVGEIQENMTKENLTDIFKPYGDIVDVWIAQPPKGGYAFVEMSELYDAKRAMRELDGTKHLDSTLKIQLTHNKGANKRKFGEQGFRGGRGGARGGRSFRGDPSKRARNDNARKPYPSADPSYPPHQDYYNERPQAPYPREEEPGARRPPRRDQYYDDPYQQPEADPYQRPVYYEEPYRDDYYARDPHAAPPRDQYAAPERDPYVAAARDPYAAPARDPYASPAKDPYATPRDPYAASPRDPYAAPARDPYAAPVRDPYAAPRDPYAAPARDPYAAPARDPYAVPARDPYAVPARDPYPAPAREPYGAPARDPYAVPARDPPPLAEKDPYAAQPPLRGPDPARGQEATSTPTKEVVKTAIPAADSSAPALKEDLRIPTTTIPEAVSVSAAAPLTANARDPHTTLARNDPRDPYAPPARIDPRDPYAVPSRDDPRSRDPYGAPVLRPDPRDPHAARVDVRVRDPYGVPAGVDQRDPYGNRARIDLRDPYARPTREDPYALPVRADPRDPYAVRSDPRDPYAARADPRDPRAIPRDPYAELGPYAIADPRDPYAARAGLKDPYDPYTHPYDVRDTPARPKPLDPYDELDAGGYGYARPPPRQIPDPHAAATITRTFSDATVAESFDPIPYVAPARPAAELVSTKAIVTPKASTLEDPSSTPAYRPATETPTTK